MCLPPAKANIRLHSGLRFWTLSIETRITKTCICMVPGGTGFCVARMLPRARNLSRLKNIKKFFDAAQAYKSTKLALVKPVDSCMNTKKLNPFLNLSILRIPRDKGIKHFEFGR